jgi:hypothetical protein
MGIIFPDMASTIPCYLSFQRKAKMRERPNLQSFSQCQAEFFRILKKFSLLFGRKAPETGTQLTATTTISPANGA